MTDDSILVFDDLRVRFRTPRGSARAVNGVSFGVRPGEVVALVGESGSGKSVTCLAAMGLLETGGRVSGGRILYRGEDLVTMSPARHRDLRGDRLAMVFQNPLTSLNPYLRVETQMTEGLLRHRGIAVAEARERAAELLRRAGLGDAAAVLRARPHELSGGMRQRVMIAMALALEPDVLFADEPTTALDVTTQARVLALLAKLARETRTAIVFVSHDLAVVAGLAHRIVVMYGGRLVEEASTEAFFASPRHPYARALLESVPRIGETQRLASIAGEPPDVYEEASGCAFAPRCPSARAACAEAVPEPVALAEDRRVACPVAEEEA